MYYIASASGGGEHTVATGRRTLSSHSTLSVTVLAMAEESEQASLCESPGTADEPPTCTTDCLFDCWSAFATSPCALACLHDPTFLFFAVISAYVQRFLDTLFSELKDRLCAPVEGLAKQIARASPPKSTEHRRLTDDSMEVDDDDDDEEEADEDEDEGGEEKDFVWVRDDESVPWIRWSRDDDKLSERPKGLWPFHTGTTEVSVPAKPGRLKTPGSWKGKGKEKQWQEPVMWEAKDYGRAKSWKDVAVEPPGFTMSDVFSAGSAWRTAVENRKGCGNRRLPSFEPFFNLKTIILPRQARDKH
eukprot:COSAG06_NODE_2350_length_7028_cov_5.760572_5_plen_303_part_00